MIAKKLLQKNFKDYHYTQYEELNDIQKIAINKAMIEFAKYHVEKALLKANEEAFAESSSSNLTSKNDEKLKLTCIHLGDVTVNKDSILKSYPLSNIK